jgi:quercetin dioxygenase-like cupin family protein
MKHSLDDLPIREVMPGFRARFIHGDNVTLAYWNVERGAQLPAHSHPHEQAVNVLDGVFELVVDGTPHVLRKGDVFTIPGNAVHAGRALTSCWLLDVFCPIREDYRTA